MIKLIILAILAGTGVAVQGSPSQVQPAQSVVQASPVVLQGSSYQLQPALGI